MIAAPDPAHGFHGSLSWITDKSGRAASHRITEGNGEDAARVLEEIVTLDPLDGDALMLLAQHYSKAGDREKAAFYYERAEGISAFEADARVRHAQMLVSESKYLEAVPLLKRAQEIKPREEVARYLEQVERIARASK